MNLASTSTQTLMCLPSNLVGVSVTQGSIRNHHLHLQLTDDLENRLAFIACVNAGIHCPKLPLNMI